MRTCPYIFIPAIAALLALGPLGLGCDSGAGYEPLHPVGGSGALLSQAQTCEDLLGRIQEDAPAKVEIQTQEYVQWYVTEDGGRALPPDVDLLDAGTTPEASGDMPDDYSETNVQVEGVDEGDIVETDGTHIYTLSENHLRVLSSWPPEDTAIEEELEIEGYPQEMFVANGRAVVFSNASDPRDGSSSCDTYYADFGYWYPCQQSGFTKITVADLTGAQPAVEREVWVEGWYRSSRRHDQKVRAIVNNWGGFHGWSAPPVWDYLAPDGEDWSRLPAHERLARIYEWREDAMASVRGTTLDDWLPDMLERTGGSVEEVPPACDRFYVTRPGLAGYGMTQIAGLDMGEPSEAPVRTGIWGSAEEVYANHETMLIAQTDDTSSYRAYEERAETYSDRTVLHRFALDATGDTVYDTSGLVPGRIADQFSMDARGEIVRVATTQTTWTPWWAQEPDATWEPPVTDNRMLTLRREPGADTLEVLGSTGPLAEGERIFSTRFMGDLAYMVTFRQVDPLFAIDLSDPQAPEVLGELKIPGFSNYMHPLDDGHLLTIGQDADAEGRVTGLALQIFDVTDPTDPQQLHKHVFSDSWGHSEANWNHKAFTYYPSRGWLAFPYVAWSSDWSSYRSSLQVFAVDTGTGFTELGSVDHTDLVSGLCDPAVNYYCRDYGFQIRRGVFIEDYVYSISNGGVRVNPASDLGTDLATVVF